MIDHDDIELARVGAKGNVDALAEIVRRHQGVVRGFLRRLCGDAARADDLAQDTFLACFDRLHTFRGDASLGAWLCGVAYRKFRSSTRSTARRRARESDAGAPDEPARCPPTDVHLDIKSAFAALPLEQRAAAALCLVSEMSHAEAAAVLQIPLGTLKSRVASAKKALASTLESYR